MRTHMAFEKTSDKALFARFRETHAQRYFGSNEHPGYKLLTSIPSRALLKFSPE